MPMILPGRSTGAWRRASESGTASPPGCLSASRPCSMYSSMLDPPSGRISPPSTCPTAGNPPSTEYETSFIPSPLPKIPKPQRRPSYSRTYPPALDPPIHEPVVQPVLAPLPELERLRLDPIPAPVRRARDLAPLVRELQLPQAVLQRSPAPDLAALRAGPRPEAAAARAAGEVGVGLLVGDARGGTFYPDLPPQFAPVEEERAARVLRELAGLAALVVGVEDEAALVVALE